MTNSQLVRTIIVIFCTAISTFTSHAAAEETALSIAVGKNAALPAKLILPESAGPFPVLIIAPGGGYDMDQPLTGGLAKAATHGGIASLRFNWRFYNDASASPSENLATEVADLEKIIAFAKTHDRLDADRIFLAGKSLGSVVTWRAATNDPAVKAIYLLTPICRKQEESAQNPLYPGLLDTTRPIVLVLGNRDPLCPLPNFYQWLTAANENIFTLVFGGNHGMKLSPEENLLTAQNEQQAVGAVVHWLKVHNQDLDRSRQTGIQE